MTDPLSAPEKHELIKIFSFKKQKIFRRLFTFSAKNIFKSILIGFCIGNVLVTNEIAIVKTLGAY
jgi:hypothetical protein